MTRTRRCSLAVLAVAWAAAGSCLAGSCLAGAATASEPVAAKPRASVTAQGLELVLVLARDRLYAFVDGIDDNAPRSVDRLTVASGSRRWEMTGVGPGLYVAVSFAPVPGRQPLTVEVAADGRSSEVETVLNVDPAAAALAGAAGGGWSWWLLAAGAALALAAVLGGRRMAAELLRLPRGAR